MKQPLVSILIPVYNAQETINRCIDSCINQTYKIIEIIVCNDGSFDNTVQLLNQYNTQIKVLKNDMNSGIAFSRNKLLNEAKGEYIAWIDADDWMVENRIETQIEFMLQHPEIDICGSAILISNLKKVKYQAQESNLIKEKLWFSNCLFQPSVMSKNFYKNEHIYYNSDFDYMEDYELWYRLKEVKKFYNLNKALTVYNMPNEDELRQKHKKYSFENKLDRLWKLKWEDTKICSLNVQDKELFKDFLRNNKIRTTEEIHSIINTLNVIKSKENSLIIHYHVLRLWVKNCRVIQKLKFLKLIKSFFYFHQLKAKYLI